MTSKDFQLIADVFKAVADDAINDQRPASHIFEAMVSDMGHRLRATNPRFDVHRFTTACGL